MKMSSDSSDDDNSDQLREAVDTQFINDAMFNHTDNQKQTAVNGHTETLLSLRPSIDKDDQFNMLGVTPQFQDYVAKQLSTVLDVTLQKRLKSAVCTNVLPKRKKSGIKLFRDSAKYVKLQKAVLLNPVRKKPATESTSDDESKCSEVAVSSDDILGKTDVKNWSTRSKAPVFRYQKTPNGTLTLID